MQENTHITENRDFMHPLLGRIHMVVRTNSHSITARWKNGIVHLNVPYGIPSDAVDRALEGFTPKMLKSQNTLRYHEGQRIELTGITINITRQAMRPNLILAQAKLPESTICVGANLDFDDEKTTKGISDMICRIAKHVAGSILLPRARQLASEKGMSPSGWSISTGKRILGRCDIHKHIALSYMLVFLPQHLRDYIVFHEMAHLSEMNHSPQFHQLCDQYCDGNEKRHIAELKKFKWPILK